MTIVNGPVPLSSTLYVIRPFEEAIWRALTHGDWVLLLGPRQHGKTSSLIRLKWRLQEAGLRSALVDLQELPAQYDFQELLAWFCTAIARELDVRPTLGEGRPDSLADWLEGTVAPGHPVVILVDEASAIRNDEDRNAFYGQIRALKSAAVAHPMSVAGRVTFLFSGTFRPESMVDEANSPFNVCRRIECEDLDIDGVGQLVDAALSPGQGGGVREAIFEHVGGQPNLVQIALDYAKNDGVDDPLNSVRFLLDRWETDSNEHVDSMLRIIARDDRLTAIAAELLRDGHAAVDPANPDFKFACVVGLARRDGPYLKFRNRLFEAVARRSPQLCAEEVAENSAGHLFPLGQQAFDFVLDAQYREIAMAAHDGAAKAMSSGAYRLALVGFGTALEAILIDFLVQIPAGTLVAAIQAAPENEKPNFNNYENAADPQTWRHVNLAKVARLIHIVNPLEIPEALRNFRNLVHPKLVKENYLSEDQLRPEAVTAAGLIAIVIRDVRRAGNP